MGAQTAQTHRPRQASDPASPNSASKPLPVVLLKQPFQTRKFQELLERVTFKWEEQRKSRKKLQITKTFRNFWENSFQMTPSQEWEHRQHRQHSPRQASDPASPNSSVSKPLPVVLLEQLSNQKISGTPGKSNFQMGRTKKIPEKTSNHKNLRNFWGNSFQMTPSQEWEHRQHRQHSPRQASDPASPNSSVSKPLPVVLLEQLSNQKNSGTPGKSNFQMGRTKKIPEKTLNHQNSRNFCENSFQMTPSQGMGAHRQHSPRQASDPASPNSSVSIASNPTRTTFKPENFRNSWKE